MRLVVVGAAAPSLGTASCGRPLDLDPGAGEPQLGSDRPEPEYSSSKQPGPVRSPLRYGAAFVSRAAGGGYGHRLEGGLGVAVPTPGLPREGGTRAACRRAVALSGQVAPRCGLDASGSHRTRSGTPRSPPPWTPDAACVTFRIAPVTATHARPAATTEPAVRSIATPPPSSPRTSPEPPEPAEPASPCPTRLRDGLVRRARREARSRGRAGWSTGRTSA